MTTTTPTPQNKKSVMSKSPYAENTVSAALLSQLPTNAESTKIEKAPECLPEQGTTIDTKILITAMDTSWHNPRISLYSPIVRSILTYFDMTKPQFCISETSATLLEKACKDAYPDIWNRITQIAASEQPYVDLERKRRKRTKNVTRAH